MEGARWAPACEWSRVVAAAGLRGFHEALDGLKGKLRRPHTAEC